MGNCFAKTKVSPTDPEPPIQTPVDILLKDYKKLIHTFFTTKPHHLTTHFCMLHKRIHEEFRAMNANEMYTNEFESIYDDFVEILIGFYEENNLLIDPALRETEQIKKMFNL